MGNKTIFDDMNDERRGEDRRGENKKTKQFILYVNSWFFAGCLQEVTTQPVMSFDPLPPLDSVISYTRPER